MPEFTRPTILMCPPDHYGIEYEINPWMSRQRQSDAAESCRQWDALKSILESLGADVRLLTPQRGLPDLVFTANAGMIVHDQVFLARFRYPPRQLETPVDEAWFSANGFKTIAVPEQWSFEGAGDALFCGDTLFGGYIIRSDAGAIQWVGREAGCRAIPLQLVDPYYYHLDTCFCPLSRTEAIWYPAAFDEYAQKAVQENVAVRIEVGQKEAARFACNAVVVGRHVLMNSGCPELEASLRELGFTPHGTPLDEFMKAGGSAKCLTLRLDGEDARVWPNVHRSSAAAVPDRVTGK
jgi:N-dimethylarginine dimethylaminohydrolase